jgi:(p)ppGpp synthase/HD superfamily hydrolase
MNEIEAKALAFATKAHGDIDQRRKYTNAPYIEHPVAVADIVRGVCDDPEVVAAAYLHDVVEDTPVALEEIRAAFGDRVAELVFWVTDKSKPGDGNRDIRKAIDRDHIAEAPAEAQTIKLADVIHNTATIEQYDPDFARVYRHEKRRLLDVLTLGDPTLMARAREQLQIASGAAS